MIPLPYLPGVALAVGVVVGGASAWYVRGVEVGRLELQIERLEASIRLAGALAESDARRAEATIAGLQSDLARSRNEGERVYVEVEKQIAAVASSTRACLQPRTVSVLRSAQGGQPAEGEGAREPLGTGLRLAPDPGGSGASEKAVADWMNAALAQYKALQARNRALVEVIQTSPCHEVVPG